MKDIVDLCLTDDEDDFYPIPSSLKRTSLNEANNDCEIEEEIVFRKSKNRKKIIISSDEDINDVEKHQEVFDLQSNESDSNYGSLEINDEPNAPREEFIETENHEIGLAENELTIAKETDLNREMHTLIKNQINDLDLKLEEIDNQMKYLKQQSADLKKKRLGLLKSLNQAKNPDQKQKEIDRYRSGQFEWDGKVKEVMMNVWNIQNFRYGQKEVVNAALDNRDCFVIMPTGGGKSLCYQLPAITKSDGITIVITPLISLIRDQIHDLQERNIPVLGLYGSLSNDYRKALNSILVNTIANPRDLQILKISGIPRLIYVTPEQIVKSKRFLSNLEKAVKANRINRFVIDECHCCSQLGHDFRPDYKKLGLLKIAFPSIPIMALTATCSSVVMDSVMEILKLELSDGYNNGCLFFASPLTRQNLRYKVINKPSSQEETIRFIVNFIQENHFGKTGIIYCLSKKDTEVVAQAITDFSTSSITAMPYHADMSDKDKNMVHQLWRSGEIKVVVATVAFGLGINHPDVRYVIHHTISKSLDGYYQESGRAGRDGLESDCVLLFRGTDLFRVSGMVVTESNGLNQLYSMISYALTKDVCRSILLVDYFKNHSERAFIGKDKPCLNCDNCLKKHDSTNIRLDCGKYVKIILKVLKALKNVPNQRLTCTMLIKLLKTSKSVNLPTPILELKDAGEIELPIPKILSKDDLEELIVKMVVINLIKEDFHFTAYSTISYMIISQHGLNFLSEDSEIPLWLDKNDNKE